MASSAIEEIKARLDAAELIEKYVPLKRAGRTFKGLCPFHGEKTPSFVVWPESGNWRCFGCGERGDIFSFVEKRENLDFPETLRLLAARAGVELPTREPRSPAEREAEDRLQAVLAAAELYFRAALAGTGGGSAREYLAGRGVSAESIERFGLGFAPQGGLLAYLERSAFTAAEAIDAGLAGQRDDGSRYEMFRQRIMFPIRDPNGRTIGFGGRTLGDAQPKYLNGPQTRLFDKSGCLFALDLARGAIRQSGVAVVVEGYLDALVAHQSGFANVVATLGTALTERHLDLLGRRASEIVFALDPDTAGQAATMRGLEVAQKATADAVIPVPDPGFRGLVRFQAIRKSRFKVLTLPAGLDPDELIRKDPDEWARLVSDASPVVDYVLNRLHERHDLSSPVGKREAVQEAMGVLRDLVDPIEREHYLQRLAAIVGLDASAVRQALQGLRPRALPTAPEQAAPERPALAEAYALALQFLVGALPTGLRAEDVTRPDARALLELLDRCDPNARDEAGFAGLVETIEPTLREVADEVGAWLPGLLPLAADRRRRELEVATLKLRQQRLRGQHQEILAVLGDEPRPEPPTAVAMLTTIAQQIQEIESALLALNGVGSMVWRPRRIGEVLGG